VFTEERQKKILGLIQRRGRLRISELTGLFGVSEVTLRADLSALERQGHLKRTHGGAVLRERSIFPGKVSLSFGDKVVPRLEAKRKIGRKAAEMIEDGMNVLLDAGTTILEIARNLKNHRDLTVITDSIPVAIELCNSEGVTVILTGGMLRSASLAVIGPESWSILENIHVQRSFIGAQGVSLEHGFFCGNIIEGETKKRMMACAEETYVVVDHSKFGMTGLVPFAAFEDVGHLLVDEITDRKLLRQLQHEKIDLIICNEKKSGAKK